MSALLSDRPKWVLAVREFVGDTVIDEKYEYPMDGSDDDLLDEIQTAVNAIICGRYGHEIIDDMCMKPEHRFCSWCGRRASDIQATPQPAEDRPDE